MLDYDTTMRLGADCYRDVLDALDAAGWPAVFTQTGGMNAALEIMLETGQILLITDADDALSWDRSEQQGWGVALYPGDDFSDGAQAHSSCDRTGTADLLALILEVLRQFARSARTGRTGPFRPTGQAEHDLTGRDLANLGRHQTTGGARWTRPRS